MTIEILPTRTALPAEPLSRRHRPRQGGWAAYRDCLRWDFGFTCPFCMLHEADLSEHGAAGEGMIWVEHHVPRTAAKAQANAYSNCLLSCRFCNNSRFARPVIDAHGRRLLDPASSAWADHFEWTDGCSLEPKAGDADAEYTYIAYRLDHAKKVVRRRYRHRLIEGSLEAFEVMPALIEKLHQEARMALVGQDVEAGRSKLIEARKWQQRLNSARDTLQRFRAIPHDAPRRCRCDETGDMTLPAWLAAQTVALSLP